jgi:PAS domain S-box-containing protein
VGKDVHPGPSAWPASGGEMGERIRAFDWERSPLGPISSWPQSLKSTVDLMMASQLAMNLVWGPERIQIYNDANRAFMGTKHPGALGRPGREDWGEVWDAAEAIHRRVFAGESITLEDHPWTLLRNDRPEETFFTGYFAPIRDETGTVAGNLGIAFETTKAVREKAERGRAEARLTAAVDLVGLGLYSWNPRTNALEWDARVKAMWGLPPEADVDYGIWRAAVHSDDLSRVEAAVAKCVDPQCEGLYDVEYRVIGISDGVERWVATRGRALFDKGQAVGFLGVALDITERKRAEQVKEVMIAELQHRTRNILAVIRSISAQTRAASNSLADYAVEFNERLAALSRVQGLLSRGDHVPVTLAELVRIELDAVGTEPDGGRIVVNGPNVILPIVSVQILALALHELATNSLKYGVLVGSEGRLEVTWNVMAKADGSHHLALEWRESEIKVRNSSDTGKKGFGRRLIEQALPYQLDASTRFVLLADGVRCSIEMPLMDGKDHAAN